MVVCTCGCEASPDARFCSGCGRPLDDPTLNDPDISVLDITGPEIVTEQAVVKAIPNQRRWIAAAGVICAALVAWSAWTLIIGGDPTTEGASPNSTPPDEADDRDANNPEAAGSTTEDAQPTSSTARTTTSQPPQIETVDAPAPILGEEVGFDLIIGTNGRPAVLDLDSGEIRYAKGGRRTPLAVTGHWLIVTQAERPEVLDLDDLGADPIQLPFSQATWVELIDYRQRSDGRAWFMVYGDGSGPPELVLVDIETGERIEQITYPESTTYQWQPFATPAEGSRLVTASSGGVYEDRGSGFRLVTDGQLIVVDEHRALVETCDERLHCSVHWLDRETWQPLDLAIPEGPIDGGQLVNGTDWLLSYNYDSGPNPNLVNIVTGQQVRIPPDESAFNSIGPVSTISPDGRWMAITSIGQVTLLELGSGRRIVVDGIRDTSGPVFFFERPR